MTDDDRFLFGDDPEARERARRYAERQARRRGEQLPPEEPDPQPPAVPPTPPVEPPAPPVEPSPPGGQPTGDEPVVAGPRTGDHPFTDFDFDAPPQTAEQALAAQRRVRREHHARGRSRKTRSRQLVGIVGVLVVAALIVGAAVGLSKLFGSGGDQQTTTTEVAPAVPTRSIVIPEGLDRRAIAKRAKEEGIKGNYMKRTEKAPKGFPMKKYGAKGAPNLEGFLFPATYDVPEDNFTAKQLVAQQLQAFEDNIAGVDMSYAESKNLTVYDVVKIASLIEREIMVPKERRLAAGVIYNRLKAGMTLGIDATIRFEDNNWTEPLVQSRLETNTPFNTRLNPGLPPTPIGNPGLASIEAAANPSRKPFLFYVVKPNTCGEHVFVETEAEFLEATRAYHAAREANGGQAPTPDDC